MSAAEAGGLRRRRTYAPFLALAIGAAVVPWAVHALEFTEARGHDGTWFAAIPMLALCGAYEVGLGRRWLLIAGIIGIAVCAVEVPGVWENATRDDGTNVQAHLAGLSRRHLAAYAALALGSLGLAALGLFRRGEPRAQEAPM